MCYPCDDMYVHSALSSAGQWNGGGMTARFVWHDLMTTDPEKATAFYTQLFGWKINPMPMGEYTYNMLMNGESDTNGFGGINQLDSSQGAPTHWLSYLYLPQGVDAGCAKITELG